MERAQFNIGDHVRVVSEDQYIREVKKFQADHPEYNSTGNAPDMEIPLRVRRYGMLGFFEGQDVFLAHGGRLGKIIGGGRDVFTVHFPEGDVREFRWWQIEKVD